MLTFQLEKPVRKCATILEDADLLGKLNSGDMIARDTMYHSPCLLDLYKKSYRKENETVFDDTDKRIYRQFLLSWYNIWSRWPRTRILEISRSCKVIQRKS